MDSFGDIPLAQQVEILSARLSRSERALRDAETALEKRMIELFESNQDLSKRETTLSRKLEIESSLLLGALTTAQMATAYGERDRGIVFSKSAAALLGLPEDEEVTIVAFAACLHPLDRDRILSQGAAFLHDEPGITRRYEHRIRRRDDGQTRWLSWSITRNKGTVGRPSHLVATVRDFTEDRLKERQVRALQRLAERRVRELARLQEDLAGAKQSVDDALLRRNRFITEMAHAIRTPLAALSGALELLRPNVEGEAAEDLTVARTASDHLGEVAAKLIEQAGEEVGETVEYAAAPSLPLAPAASTIRAKVLLAEDTESNRYVMERLLAELGCEVTSVENGAAAVDAVRRDSFDLVLMDVMMPIMDGEQATQSIRALSGPAARTPIIGVTAHSLQSERERLLSSGMTACLSKPVRKDMLETAIRTALISGRGNLQGSARFDYDLFRRAFTQLPAAYRERMREASKKDISKYAAEVLVAVEGDDEEALSRSAHSLIGVSLNIGAIGIVEELAEYREKLPTATAQIDAFRAQVAASLLAVDDLYAALVVDDQ